MHTPDDDAERILYRYVALNQTLNTKLERSAANTGCPVNELIIQILNNGLAK